MTTLEGSGGRHGNSLVFGAMQASSRMISWAITLALFAAVSACTPKSESRSTGGNSASGTTGGETSEVDNDAVVAMMMQDYANALVESGSSRRYIATYDLCCQGPSKLN